MTHSGFLRMCCPNWAVLSTAGERERGRDGGQLVVRGLDEWDKGALEDGVEGALAILLAVLLGLCRGSRGVLAVETLRGGSGHCRAFEVS